MTNDANTTRPIERAKHHAAELTEQAQDSLRSEARARAKQVQSHAAGEAESVARAADAAASELPQGSLQAQATQQLAQGLEQVAETIRTADLEKVLRDTGNFARKNPMLFLGGAALLGFAATRFLKSSSEDRRQASGVAQDLSDDPWDAYEAGNGPPASDSDYSRDATPQQTTQQTTLGTAPGTTRRVS
ncbi:hypothetical protein [Phaeobacter porticola]|uniref:DUF3618 domain-containing protein n=1 Tax=Phaeobacter porticola TaxID=1844006 RepID=A0A1L3I7F2_9RHOB|nr:hypothetical protein [Phaeobacter porticola]APG48024.1 hypothetical protein PhaeoP97_02646 [Phaeobacter porticola]